MDYGIVSRPGFTIVGISVRTSNSQPEKIGALWQQFYSQDIVAKIPHRKSDDVHSLYIDYEGDYTQPYTLIIGYPADDSAPLPVELVAKTVRASKYAVFSATGPQPQTLISLWQQIWTSGLPRAYRGDFDVYSSTSDPSEQQVSVFVSIR